MARYIDADELLNALKEERKNGNFVFTSKWIKEIMDNLPSADVVPKSEVEKWFRECEVLQGRFIELEKEVAREIFEEIERTLPNEFPFLGTAVAVYLAELKKKYTKEGENTI